MTPAACRTCDAPIIWTVTTKGKKMPVDADQVSAPRGFRLRPDPVLAGPEEAIVATFTAMPEPGELLYVCHFATCPEAQLHRKPA